MLLGLGAMRWRRYSGMWTLLLPFDRLRVVSLPLDDARGPESIEGSNHGISCRWHVAFPVEAL